MGHATSRACVGLLTMELDRVSVGGCFLLGSIWASNRDTYQPPALQQGHDCKQWFSRTLPGPPPRPADPAGCLPALQGLLRPDAASTKGTNNSSLIQADHGMLIRSSELWYRRYAEPA
jgi:hypothetical protein